MAKLLFIEASPRGSQATSSRLAETYVTALGAHNADLEIDRLDLWQSDLPPYDGDKVSAKLNIIFGRPQEGTVKTAWDEIVSYCDRFKAADRYVIAAPMWNGGIPYRLKHYIDIIQQPSLIFTLTPERGYEGLLKDKHATLILTAGAFSPSAPSPGFGADHHSTYLRFWLNQAGVDAIDEIRFEPTILTADYEGDLCKAEQQAKDLAKKHGRV